MVLGLILLASVGPLSLLVVRDRPRDGSVGGERRLDPKDAYGAMVGTLHYTNRAFWLVTAAFFLGLAATFAMLFHQVAYLQDLGFPPAGVAAAVGTPVSPACRPASFSPLLATASAQASW